MDRQILNITANEQILTCDNPIKISTNKVNYIEAHFTLGDNWSGYDSVRAVWFNDFYCISTVLDSLGNCVVPFEVMKRKGNVKVNLVGSISEDDVLTDRLTSYPVVAVIVDCTAQITGANTSPITPSEFEQFAQRVHTDADRAEQGASEAETSAQNASDSATSAHNSAESAHDDKIAIEQAIAEVIQQIEDFEQVQVVVNTLPPSSQATSDFTDGVLTLGIPQGVKGDTGNGIQSIAKTGTSGLVDTYTITFTDGQTTTFNVTNGQKGDTGNGIQNIAKTSTVGLVDTYTITYTNGTTTTFTVTNGEKGDKGDTGEVSLSELEDATIVQTLSDNTPYNYRRTNNGQGSGHREYDEIVGASVGWNQLVRVSNIRETRTVSDVTFTNNSDGSVSLSGTPSATSYMGVTSVLYFNGSPFSSSIKNHKFLIGSKTFKVDNVAKDASAPHIITNADAIELTYTFTSGVAVSEKIYPQIFDLTLMLGSTIADYVYTLEQSTAGSGVAWLKTHFPKLFDNGYQPYDSGSIKSVSGLTAHEMVGVNVWDEEWEVGLISASNGQNTPSDQYCRTKNYISVIPSTDYYLKNVPHPLYLRRYGRNKEYLGYGQAQGNGVWAFPSDTYFVRFCWDGTTYNHDICINLSDTSINGQYFPYEKHTYPLDSSVTLRGQYKLDANNNLYADGDVWKSVGQADRNYNEIDLGSLDWTLNAGNQFYASLPSDKYGVNDESCVCAKYVSANVYGSAAEGIEVRRALAWIRDSRFTDASALKTSLNGVRCVYKVETPSTISATPYTSPQWCDSHGTEEYVGSELPVGHNTDYPMSLSDTVPSASGNYTLKCTVVNGKPTFTWQSV